MEATIRNALDRAGSPDKAARTRIYHSAFEALKRNLDKNGVTDEALLQAQGAKLKDLIVAIEAEYGAPAPMSAPISEPPAGEVAPVVPPIIVGNVSQIDEAAASDAPEIHPDGAPAGDVPSLAETRAQTNQVRQEPAFGFPPETAAKAPPNMDPVLSDMEFSVRHDHEHQATTPTVHAGERDAAAPDVTLSDQSLDDGLTLQPMKAESAHRANDKFRKAKKPPRDKKAKRKHGIRHVFASGFSALVLLSFFGIGLWWMYDTGAFQSAETRDTSVPNPPPQVSSEDYAGNGSSPRPLNPDADSSGEWTTIYKPQSNEPIEAGSDTDVALSGDETANGLQIRSNDSGERGEVVIPVKAAALQQLAGRNIVFGLTVHSVNDEAVQFYVRCDFGTLGDCGRHRFETRQETADALLEVDFTSRLAPNEDGKIFINADVFGTGRGVELLSIRARPAN